MNIIFGVYNGYTDLKTDRGGLYYYVKSLRKYNTRCRVIVLCEKNNIFNGLTEFCNENRVELYSDFTVKYNLTYYRFEIYRAILETIQEPIEKILLSDMNDVIFQEDPFSIEFSEELYCATEKNILNQTTYCSLINMNWIKECNDVLPFDYMKFTNQPVVCAGTILGTSEGIKRYLEFYFQIQEKKIVNDQGLYNIYVYNYLQSKVAHKYTHSKILTLDNINFNELQFHKDKRIVNENNEVYSILHQIDRCNLNYMLELV